MGDIADFDMYCLAERYLSTRRVQREIAELKEKSREKREVATEKFWGSL